MYLKFPNANKYKVNVSALAKVGATRKATGRCSSGQPPPEDCWCTKLHEPTQTFKCGYNFMELKAKGVLYVCFSERTAPACASN